MGQEWKNLPEDTSNIFGFIYLIRNHHPDATCKYYIGTKQCLKRVKRKPLKGKNRNRISYVDNDIEKYWGSSKKLLDDIEKYGIEHFTREIIEICHSKFHCKYAELCWQMKCNVLMDERFYNGIINVRLGVVPKDYVDIERNFDTLKLT
jgi:hypothetical protein